jgi:hypothetical protein
MACATLKRHLDLDPLYSPNNRPAKRRRLVKGGFMGITAGSPLGGGANRDENPSPFATGSRYGWIRFIICSILMSTVQIVHLVLFYVTLTE